MTVYRLLMRAVFVTLAPLVGGSVLAAPVLDFTGGSVQVIPGDIDATIGWKFTVTSPITIEGLGLFDFGADGLAQSHEIALWTGAGSLLANTTITTANSTSVASTSSFGTWLSTPITNLTLATGDYVIGAFYAASSPDQFISMATASTIPGVTWDEYRATVGAGFPTTFAATGNGFFGPNLFTTTTPIPEPTSLILFGSGLAGLAAWRKRRSKQG